MSHHQISINDTDDLLGLIPTLLGYHPTDSIVVLGLAGQPRRVDVVIRGDYPPADRMIDTLTDVAHRLASLADAVIVVLYQQTVADVPDAQLRAVFPIPVVAVVRVSDPAPHQLHPQSWADAVLAGRRVLPTRDHVAGSIAHHPEIPAPRDLDAWLAPFTDAGSRDRFVQLHAQDPAMVADLIELAQRAPDSDPRTPNLCAALAILAYRRHDSALANAALDRALHLHPGHRLARLLRRAINAGIHPDRIAATLRPDPPD